MFAVIISVITFVIVIGLIPPVAILARRFGLVDAPNKRKVHEGVIPLIGGVVVFPVFMIAMMVLMGFQIAQVWAFLLALLLLLIVGVVDDRFEISAWPRFSVQVFVAFLVVIGGDLRLEHLGDLFSMGHFVLGFMAIPFAVAAVTLLINALNLLDGVDGLSGSQGVVISGWLLCAAFLSGSFEQAQFLMPLISALAGFLIYNMRYPGHKKASVFMGDAGSLSLGLVLSWFAISLAKDPVVAVAPISVAWVLALPIMDTCAQFYRRAREGRHPFDPDRGHFHHHFLNAGFSPGQTCVILAIISMILGGIGVMGAVAGVPQIVLTILWIFLLLSHMVISEKPHRYVSLFMKLRCTA